MKHSQFKIGRTFWMSGKKYRCADIGTRYIVAVYQGIPLPVISRSYDPKTKKTTRRMEDANTSPWYFTGRYDAGDIILPCELDACQAVKTKWQAELEKGWLTPKRKALHYRRDV